jgi:hypothetical protein
MEKEKAPILLPDGTIVIRTVASVLKQVGPLCVGAWQRTIMYKGEKFRVEEYKGEYDAKYVLSEKQ